MAYWDLLHNISHCISSYIFCWRDDVMKKRGYIFILFFTMIMVLCPIVAGAVPVVTDSSIKIYDEAGLFSDEEEVILNEKSKEVAESYDMDVVIVTVNSTEDKTAEEYAEDFYDENGFGVGESHDGIIMIIDMGGRTRWLVTTGNAIQIFTDYYIDAIWEDVTPYFSKGAFFDGAQEFYAQVAHYNEGYIEYSENHNYISEYQEAINAKVNHGGIKNGPWVLSGIIAFFISSISIYFMKQKNNAVKRFTDGSAYIKKNSFNIEKQSDTFAGTHTTKTRIQKNDNNSWGGGSSTHCGSSGTSHGGGGGKF